MFEIPRRYPPLPNLGFWIPTTYLPTYLPRWVLIGWIPPFITLSKGHQIHYIKWPYFEGKKNLKKKIELVIFKS